MGYVYLIAKMKIDLKKKKSKLENSTKSPSMG